MLVFLAAPARSGRSTDSPFNAELMIDAENKPILEESLVRSPLPRGVALNCVSSRDENAGYRLPTLARPVVEKCLDCKGHAPRRRFRGAQSPRGESPSSVSRQARSFSRRTCIQKQWPSRSG